MSPAVTNPPHEDVLRAWADAHPEHLDTHRRTTWLEWAVLAVVLAGLVAVVFVVLALD